MRQQKYEIRNHDRIESLLRESLVGRLGTVGPEGWPMVKPLNYAYDHGRIYFHSAREGEKIDHLTRESRVCFEVDMPQGFVPARDQACQASFRYASVIVRGRARIVGDRSEQISALDALMRKYQPEGGYGANYPEEKLTRTCVVCIEIEEMTGKSNAADYLTR